ncbi:hypothetical protein XA68_17203 [Ophiocordyceps unilateralis]|uniref:Uncharacterized protein n=1 Tax=Ophiocordyceps unilateralis TaxID=268505 RepID=A0A2A9P3T9_OPHUN|nr:hypothetical protein XA68_17203 [Ophiocordyceps unilateralis]
MYSAYGVLAPDALPMAHAHDIYDHLSTTHMPVSQRPTRGQPQRSMRINKPSSANSSPRSCGRRRSVMVDGSTPTRQRQMMEYLAIPYSGGRHFHNHHHHHQQQRQRQQQQYHDVMVPPKQSFRPMSWHPTSYMHPPQPQRREPQTGGYPFPVGLYAAADGHDLSLGQPHFSPMMSAAYSNDTSPCSTFSPLPLFPDGGSLARPDAWDFSQRATPLYTPTSSDDQCMSEPMAAAATQQKALAADWDAFVMQGYNATSPPTPENPPTMQHTQPQVPVPYQALDEAEEEGEVLVGMGL